MAKGQKYSMKGILRGVEVTNGQKKDGSTWERASLKIEKKDGTSGKVATFNGNDIKTANSLNGKEVEAIYTKSFDGKYNNLEDGQIKAIGQGEAPITTSEEIKSEEVAPEEGTNNFNSEGKTTAPIEETPDKNKMSKEDWANKDKRSYRAMSISYAKDMVIGEKIKIGEMTTIAEGMFKFIWDGTTK